MQEQNRRRRGLGPDASKVGSASNGGFRTARHLSGRGVDRGRRTGSNRMTTMLFRACSSPVRVHSVFPHEGCGEEGAQGPADGAAQGALLRASEGAACGECPAVEGRACVESGGSGREVRIAPAAPAEVGVRRAQLRPDDARPPVRRIWGGGRRALPRRAESPEASRRPSTTVRLNPNRTWVHDGRAASGRTR